MIRQTQIGRHSAEYLYGNTQDCRGHEKEGKTKNYHRPGNRRDMTAKCNVVPWIEL